jgi:outer membrane lipoprotein-sorting protein/peroxiredoxin
MHAAVAGVIAITAIAGAQDDAAKARFEESKKALADIKSLQFEIKTKTTGMFAIEIEGQAAMQRTEGGRWLARFHGETKREDLPTYDVIVDGDYLTWTDHKEKLVKTRPERAARHPQILLGRRYGFIPQLLEADPFTSVPGTVTSVELKGEEKVGGEPCDVIAVTLENDQVYTWSISKEDHLPRKLVHALPQAFETTQVVTKLRANAEIAPDYFEMVVPEGFKKQAVGKPGPANIQDGVVNAGRINTTTERVAPIFEVPTIGGETVSLESMRGEVVVLEFLFTRSGVSRRVAEDLKPFVEAHPDVKIISLPVKERERADTVEFYKDRDIKATVATEGDEIAERYGVKKFPHYILISKEGTILHETGFKPGSKFASLAEKLQKYLAGEMEPSEGGADGSGNTDGGDGG